MPADQLLLSITLTYYTEIENGCFSEAAPGRFGKAHPILQGKKISKTEAIERGIELLIERDLAETHPAYLAYKSLKLVPENDQSASGRPNLAIRAAMNAKYPD